MTWWQWLLVSLGAGVATYAALRHLTTANWDVKEVVRLRGKDRTIYLHEDSEWLELLKQIGARLNRFGKARRFFRFLRHIDLDVMGQQTERHLHFDRKLADVPLEILLHELKHLDRWINAPHIPLPVLDDATRSLTLYADYVRDPKSDEADADRAQVRWLNNAKPDECWVPPSCIARFGPPTELVA